MSAERPDGTPRSRVESIFHAAAEADPAARAALLDRMCAGDAAVRAEVESLLAQFDSGTLSLLHAKTPIAAALAEICEKPGDVIGHYRLVEVLGEGGFGVVWVAEQSQPVRRQVALKILKVGMDSAQILSRFEQERQALALMDHPGIAKVLDAGTTAAGRPFFVMELVRGEPLIDFCDRRRLPLDSRLRLFVGVCRAVQHAHQKGIIHRDLKPSNILVSEGEGGPRPRVIDFGIAKAIQQQITDQPLQTLQGQVMGTPEYMSPEQAASAIGDIDTRTDIYSLGVILYQLATGVLPFDSATLRSRGLGAMQRMILDTEPPRPTGRLGSIDAESRRRVALARGTDEHALKRRLRGDLEWITLKAMAKDRSRRYDSAADLAADLERHLDLQPVAAGPPDTLYRLGKFVRRHRVGVAAGTVAVLALAAGAVSASLGFIRASRERDRALAAEHAAGLARDRAQTDARRARAVTDFLTRMLTSVKPSEARGREVTVKAVLDESASRARTEFASDPEILADLQVAIGSTYRVLDRFDDAEPHLASALELRRAALGDDHPATTDARIEWAHWLIDRGRYDEADASLRDVVGRLRGQRPVDEARLARGMTALARVLYFQTRNEECERAAREALDLRRRILTPPHGDIADSLDTLARALDALGKKADAVALFEESLAMREALLGEASPALGTTLNNLASLYHDLGRYDQAETMYLRSIGILEHVHGRVSANIVSPLNNLAILYQDKGDYPAAERAFRESLDIRRKVYGPEHPAVANAINSLGGLMFSVKRYEEALALFEEALEMQRRLLGPNHTHALVSIGNIGAALMRLDRHDEAMAALREALAANERVHGPDSRYTLSTLINIANLHLSMGQPLEAEAVGRQVLAVRARVLGEDHPDTQIARRIVATALARQNRLDEAERLAEQLCLISERREKAIPSETRANAALFAELAERAGRADEAESWRARMR